METHIRGERELYAWGLRWFSFLFLGLSAEKEGVDVMGYEKIIAHSLWEDDQHSTVYTADIFTDAETLSILKVALYDFPIFLNCKILPLP